MDWVFQALAGIGLLQWMSPRSSLRKTQSIPTLHLALYENVNGSSLAFSLKILVSIYYFDSWDLCMVKSISGMMFRMPTH